MSSSLTQRMQILLCPPWMVRLLMVTPSLSSTPRALGRLRVRCVAAEVVLDLHVAVDLAQDLQDAFTAVLDPLTADIDPALLTVEGRGRLIDLVDRDQLTVVALGLLTVVDDVHVPQEGREDVPGLLVARGPHPVARETCPSPGRSLHRDPAQRPEDRQVHMLTWTSNQAKIKDTQVRNVYYHVFKSTLLKTVSSPQVPSELE